MREIQEIADKLKAADPAFDATVRCFFTREPFEVLPMSASSRAVDRATEAVLGRKAAHFGDTPGWMRRCFRRQAPRPSSLEPQGAGAHAAEEWVDIESVAQTGGNSGTRGAGLLPVMRCVFNPFFDPEACFASADPAIPQFHASLRNTSPRHCIRYRAWRASWA